MKDISIHQHYAIERIIAEQEEVKRLDEMLTAAILSDTKDYSPSGFFSDEPQDPVLAKKARIDQLKSSIQSAKARAGDMAFALINNDQILDI